MVDGGFVTKSTIIKDVEGILNKIFELGRACGERGGDETSAEVTVGQKARDDLMECIVNEINNVLGQIKKVKKKKGEPIIAVDFSKDTWRRTLMYAVTWPFLPLLVIISKASKRPITIN